MNDSESMAISRSPGILPLDCVPAGQQATVLHVDPHHESAHQLRRLGCCEGACIEVLHGHDPCMIRCDGACIALQRDLLKAVCVHCPYTSSPTPAS